MNSKPSGCNILIVDHSPERAQLIRRYLQEDALFPFVLNEVATGAEALTVLNQQPLQAIFLAEGLLDMTVIDFLATIRARQPFHSTPILVMMEAEKAATVKSYLAAGATFCFVIAQTSPLLVQQIVQKASTLKSEFISESEAVDMRGSWLSDQLRALAIIDSLPEHIAVLDNTGVIVAVNKAGQTFALENQATQNAIQSHLGVNYLETCEAATGECSEEARIVGAGIKAVLRGTTDHFRLEYPCHSPTQERWFLLQVTPLKHVGGGVVISHLNITERRKIEAQLATLLSEAQSAREVAESANRAKDEFIAQVTHDLRSPLSAILGWAKVLKHKKVDDETRADAINTIADSAEKQKHLIEDLLDVFRMTTGKLRLDIRPVSLSEVIRSAMEIMKPACDAKGIECTTELMTGADDVTGDPSRLEQVIWNLVSNAVKFTPDKGKVKVRMERADPYVRIIVSDTGRGIKPEHLPLLFDRYWQPDTSSGKRKAGLGLGLSLVKHIVELHGGTVSAESEGEGKGASFVINLPYRAVRMQNKDEVSDSAPACEQGEQSTDPGFLEPSISSSALQGLNVLVVDDEQSARELVAEILRQHGAEVTKADSASKAFEIIAQATRIPDLLVSDISMPEEDGYMLIRKIRRLSPDDGGLIPAIALTAFGRMEDRVRALSAGFQMHLPKPVEPAELAIVAANLTDREYKDLLP